MEEKNDTKYFLDELTYRIEKSYNSKNRIKSILQTYMIIGVLLFIFSSLYFALSFIRFEVSANQRLTLILSGVSISISIIAKLYINILKEKEKEKISIQTQISKITDFMINWSTFERTLDRFISVDNISDNKFSYNINFDILVRRGYLTFRDSLNLDKALDIRNQIVHGEFTFAIENIEKLTKQIEEITDKLISQM